MSRCLIALLALLILGIAAPAHAARVAVMEFANLSQDPDWGPLGKGLQEMFLVDLDKAGAIEIVPRRALRDQALALGIGSPAELAERKELAASAGASHLLSGSFRVEGEQLHLRVELLDTPGGTVLLTDERSGASEAFFELQKQALQASLGALDLDLSARERAETGRLHTADFGAFQDFSRGLDLFDAERYDASLTALRAATERDAEFSLARLTLDTYERLIAQTRQKAQAIHTVKIEERRLQRLQDAGEEVDVVRRLLQVAGREGPQHERLRTTALHTLAVAYGNVGTRKNKLATLRKLEDRFAMARSADQLWARYHAEALRLWPKLPIHPTEKFYRGLPSSQTFDEDLQKAATHLWEHGADYPENRRNYLLSDLRYARETGKALHLSMADQVALQDRYLELAAELQPSEQWVRMQDEERIKSYRLVLRFDDSTRLLQAFAERSDNEWALKGFAQGMETNRDFRALLEEAPDRAVAEEWLTRSVNGSFSPSGSLSTGRKHFLSRPLTPEALNLLTRVRRFPSDDFVLLDEVPVWRQQGHALSLGPATDARRTPSLRYNQLEPDRLSALLLFGAEPLNGVELRTSVIYEAPDDFWPGRVDERGLAEGRPTVGVLFGLTDIDVPLQPNPAAEASSGQRTDEDVPRYLLTRPMQGYMVRVTDSQVELLRIVEAERGSYDRKERLDVEVLGSTRLKRPGDALGVHLQVQGDRAVVNVEGASRLQVRLPTVPVGFQGLWIDGQGFAEIEGLTMRGEAGAP